MCGVRLHFGMYNEVCEGRVQDDGVCGGRVQDDGVCAVKVQFGMDDDDCQCYLSNKRSKLGSDVCGQYCHFNCTAEGKVKFLGKDDQVSFRSGGELNHFGSILLTRKPNQLKGGSPVYVPQKYKGQRDNQLDYNVIANTIRHVQLAYRHAFFAVLGFSSQIDEVASQQTQNFEKKKYCSFTYNLGTE